MIRRLVRLFWPVTILLAVFAWRAVGCKQQPQVEGKGPKRHPTRMGMYTYPPAPPTATIRAGVTSLPLEPQ
jgi:hypothetical protein